MQILLQDLHYGARMLMKKTGFTVIAVVTPALGIGASTATCSVVNAVLLCSLPSVELERLLQNFETTRLELGQIHRAVARRKPGAAMQGFPVVSLKNMPGREVPAGQ